MEDLMHVLPDTWYNIAWVITSSVEVLKEHTM